MEKSRKLWLIILLAVVVYLVMSVYADFGKLASAMKDFQMVFLPALLALTTVNYLLRFLKWDFLLRRAGVYLGIKDNLFVFFSALSMVITPGKLGEVWKGWLIKGINRQQLSKTVPVVLVERITDVLGLVVLSLFGILYYGQAIYVIIALLVIVGVFFTAVRSETISQRILSVFEKKVGRHAENAETMHKAFQTTMEPKGFLAMTLLGAFAWFFECIGLYLVVMAFGESISMGMATFTFSFASLAGAISMIPGGLGVAEAGISGLLRMFEFTPAVSVGSAMIIRFATLWYGAVLGLLVYLIFKSKIAGKTRSDRVSLEDTWTD